MKPTVSHESRGSLAEREGLASLERELQASDPSWRRKYIQNFHQAYGTYQSVLDGPALTELVANVDIILIGDYHALPASQNAATQLLKNLSETINRPIVLGVETVFSRDQHILDEWWQSEITEAELRRRIRFDLDWGYEWRSFYQLLLAAHKHADTVYGLDCMPREDLRKINARDRHAAHKIAEIRDRHRDAVIVVMFGESHLAPQHLPALLHDELKEERILTILQNVDALYWRSLEEQNGPIAAVQVQQEVVCLFNASPLEKYESYRVCLDRWQDAKSKEPDFAPTIYKMIDGLVRFLNIDRYSPHNGTQPKFLIDLLPEIYGPSIASFRRVLRRYGTSRPEAEKIFQRIEERGCFYFAPENAFFIKNFSIGYAAAEATRFLHCACQNLPDYRMGKNEGPRPERDCFHASVLKSMLTHFGSQILSLAKPVESLESSDISKAKWERLESELAGQKNAEQVGYTLGASLYSAFLNGWVTRTDLKRIFLAPLHPPQKARELCLHIARRIPPAK